MHVLAFQHRCKAGDRYFANDRTHMLFMCSVARTHCRLLDNSQSGVHFLTVESERFHGCMGVLDGVYGLKHTLAS